MKRVLMGIALLTATACSAPQMAVMPALAPAGAVASAASKSRSGPPTGSLGDVQAWMLEGAKLVADDGKVLGVWTNEYASDSLFNPYGTPGNPYAADSIFNKYGTYGSEYHALSPWNAYSSTPPAFKKDGRVIGYLSRNRYKMPNVDPDKAFPGKGP